MQIKTRDQDLVKVLGMFSNSEKDDFAKVLKYENFENLKEKYNDKNDPIELRAQDGFYLEKAVRYVGSHTIFDGLSEDWASYNKILRKVAKHLKVQDTYNATSKEYEVKIIRKVLDTIWDKMETKDKNEFEEIIDEFENEMRADDPAKLEEILKKYKIKNLHMLAPGVLFSAGLAFKSEGFFSYEILAMTMGWVSRNFIVQGTRMAAQRLATRGAAMAVPIVNMISGVWLTWDVINIVFSPSMRKIIPAILIIGIARMKYA